MDFDFAAETAARSDPGIAGSATRRRCALHAEVEGDKATLYFECLWMDVDNNSVGTHSFSDMKLARVHGHWLVKGIRVGKIENP
jgi:hypothetical protein